MTAQAKPVLNDKPALVVFGRDEAGKAHASWFTEGEAKLAEKAAKLMNLSLLRIHTDTERTLAAQVPKGRVFASGKAFVPFVKASLFLELQTAAVTAGVKPLKLVTSTAATRAGNPPVPVLPSPSEPPKGTSAPKPPCGWADIQVGSVVLATEGPMEGWFESVVIRAEDSDKFVLKWRDWPDEPTFVRRRVFLGLMHPAGGTRA